ncbi:MAG: IS66 family insertion sequence element accessory protein TnpB [Tannerellaceae bacterium]|jgi:hypothetical protein|nr:IS66 family insertion sequence element accessory protein TnpB [Tannerellaceae bacterium]
MSCSVLYYRDKNEKLLGLLSEGNNFDSVLFIFDGGRRYRFPKEDLGIRSPGDLLVRNRGVLSLLNPLWDYYLYLLDERHTYSIDGLCGKVLRCYGRLPLEGECHVFVSKNKHHLTLLYKLSGEYISIQRQLRQGTFPVKKETITEGFRSADWPEINRLLSVEKKRKKRVVPSGKSLENNG